MSRFWGDCESHNPNPLAVIPAKAGIQKAADANGEPETGAGAICNFLESAP